MPRPFRADHVGSLLRPPELLRARDQFARGAFSADALRSEMLQDVVRIVRDEVQALIQDGVDYIQMDAPFYGVFIDEQHRATLRQSGVDPDVALREVVAADNAAIEGLSRDNVTLAL